MPTSAAITAHIAYENAILPASQAMPCVAKVSPYSPLLFMRFTLAKNMHKNAALADERK